MLNAKAIHAAVWGELQRRRQSGCTRVQLGLQVRSRDTLPIGSLFFAPDWVLHAAHVDLFVDWAFTERRLMHEPIFIDLDHSLVLLHHRSPKANDIEIVSYDSLELNLCTTSVNEITGVDHHHLSMEHDYSDGNVDEQYVVEIQGMGDFLLDTQERRERSFYEVAAQTSMRNGVAVVAGQVIERKLGKSPLLAAPYGTTKPPFGF